MKIIEVDDELYQFIASKTQRIGEPASDILRRLVGFEPAGFKSTPDEPLVPTNEIVTVSEDKQVSVDLPSNPQSTTKISKIKVNKVPRKAKTSKDKEALVALQAAKKAEKLASKAEQEQLDVEAIKDLQPSEQLQALALSDIDKQGTVVGRFLYMLEMLQQAHPQPFTHVLDIKGRDRLYFAGSEDALMDSGSSTNPKEIGKTGFWVMTNSNTPKKASILAQAAQMLGYSESDLKILAYQLQTGKLL